MNIKRITVEPTLLLYGVAIQVTNLVDVNLLLQKACHPELTGQPDPTLKCDDETSAQKVITDINTWKPVLDSIVSSFFIISIGQWSDTHGKRRKPMLIIPIIGEIMCLLSLLMSVFFWRLSPQMTVLLSISRSLTGGFSCVMAGCLIYISDITNEEERTIRVGLMESMYLIGALVGGFLAGLLRVRLNFYGTYAVCILLNVVALLWTVKLVKNSAVEKTELKMFEGVFYPKDIIENFKILVKRRQHSGRLVLILTFLVIPMFVASQSGESSVFYLYARYKFKMDETQYDYFATSRRIATLVGIIPVIIIFFKLFKVSDAVFGLLASATQVVSGLCNAAAQKQYQLLAFTLLGTMGGLVTITSRSLLTKVVDTNELGRITSLQSALDTFIPIIAVPIYNRFYRLTFEFTAGAFFLLDSCVAVVLLIFFVIIVYIERKRKQGSKSSGIDESSDTELGL